MKNSIYGAFLRSKRNFLEKLRRKGEQESEEEKIPFTKIKILRKGAEFMMQNTVTCVISMIMSMILVVNITPTKKLSNTEMAILTDQNAEILNFRSKLDVFSRIPDIPHIITDSVRTKTMTEDVEMAAGLSS